MKICSCCRCCSSYSCCYSCKNMFYRFCIGRRNMCCCCCCCKKFKLVHSRLKDKHSNLTCSWSKRIVEQYIKTCYFQLALKHYLSRELILSLQYAPREPFLNHGCCHYHHHRRHDHHHLLLLIILILLLLLCNQHRCVL